MRPSSPSGLGPHRQGDHLASGGAISGWGPSGPGAAQPVPRRTPGAPSPQVGRHRWAFCAPSWAPAPEQRSALGVRTEEIHRPSSAEGPRGGGAEVPQRGQGLAPRGCSPARSLSPPQPSHRCGGWTIPLRLPGRVTELESSPAQDGNSEIRSGSVHALEATFLELRQETREGSPSLSPRRRRLTSLTQRTAGPTETRLWSRRWPRRAGCERSRGASVTWGWSAWESWSL